MKKLILLLGLLTPLFLVAQNKSDSVNISLLKDTTNKIFLIVEQPPMFPGGADSMKVFLNKNIHLTEKTAEFQGTIYVSFIVDKTGAVTQVKITRGFFSDIDEEAIRVVKLMPKWIPGKQSGNTVNVQMTIPIRFKLQ